jgi:hypothetical protein
MTKLSLNKVALATLILLASSLPFEWLGVPLGPLRITNLEIVAAAVIFFGGLLVWQRKAWRRPGWTGFPRSWLVLGILFVLALFLSALLAPEQQANALKAGVRTVSGLLVALTIPQIIRRKRDLRLVAVGLVAGAAVSLLLGWLEIVMQDRFLWLDSLRLFPTEAGPFLRLSATFNHANQAAMYIEATLPLLAALVWEAGRQRQWGWVAVGGLLLLVWLQGSILTYSRASYVTIVLAFLLVAALVGWRAPSVRRRLAFFWTGLAVGLVLLLGVNFVANPVLRLRLQSEEDTEWYRIRVAVPADITLPAGETVTPTLVIHNDGLLIWRSAGANPINVGARWALMADEAGADTQLAAEPRWPLPDTVRPGEQITLLVPLQVPFRPGPYQLEWDMVQEGVVWFGDKTGITYTSTVIVEENRQERLDALSAGDGAAALSAFVAPRAVTPPIPGRSLLWPLAGRMWLTYPLTGVGLDNFRLLYGPFNGQDIWNDTVTTNSWYMETVVSLGILGSIPFFFWLALLVWDVFRRLRLAAGSIWTLAIATALFAYLIHGLLDYFLLFYNTGLLFWLLVGLWVANKALITPDLNLESVKLDC